jgi:hypothetical protein
LNSIASNRGADLYIAVTRNELYLRRRKRVNFEGFRFDDLTRTKKKKAYCGCVELSTNV